ncbi:hypothetical protein DVH24_014051 [Malus domestica]|uniref:Uncharacterized protein n=1 Tax=Malus domestica TaxID=3750 RepID=A0A498JF55_MALDO|nr:hypothetical protein DVH24_014051 [Malus domestica]
MSHLIRSCKAVTTAPRLIPLPPTSAAIALVEMDPSTVNLVDSTLASSTFSVVLPVSTRRAHRRPRMPDTTSASTTDASGS